MSDERRRRLERLSVQGDMEAEERLYWDDLRSGLGGTQLLDKLVESLLALHNGGTLPTVWEKRWFVNGAVGPWAMGEEARQQLADQWRRVEGGEDLHRIPRPLREPGFTVYVVSDQSVYRLNADRQWRRLCRLSAEPPGYPFYVVQTLRDRDALDVGNRSRASCLVLENGGIYRTAGVRGPSGSNRHYSTEWTAVRFERARP